MSLLFSSLTVEVILLVNLKCIVTEWKVLVKLKE